MGQINQPISKGKFVNVSFGDNISLVDDATQIINLSGLNAGQVQVKYITAAGVINTANFLVYTTSDTVTIGNPDNSDFDNANTDAKFDFYADAGIIYLKNRTGATVTCNLTGLFSK